MFCEAHTRRINVTEATDEEKHLGKDTRLHIDTHIIFFFLFSPIVPVLDTVAFAH